MSDAKQAQSIKEWLDKHQISEDARDELLGILGEASQPTKHPEPEWVLRLNKYQRDNLAWLISLIGHGSWSDTGGVAPFKFAHTGDWVGEIGFMLDPRDKSINPNRSVEEIEKYIESWIHSRYDFTDKFRDQMHYAVKCDAHGKAVVVWRNGVFCEFRSSPSKGSGTGEKTIICVSCQNPWPGGMCAKCVNTYMTAPNPNSSAFADELFEAQPVVWLTRFSTDNMLYGLHSSRAEAEKVIEKCMTCGTLKPGVELTLDGPYVRHIQEVPDYDPIVDEKKPFTLNEWAASCKSEIDKYLVVFGENPNEFHSSSHSWDEWSKSFWHYMSF